MVPASYIYPSIQTHLDTSARLVKWGLRTASQSLRSEYMSLETNKRKGGKIMSTECVTLIMYQSSPMTASKGKWAAMEDPAKNYKKLILLSSHDMGQVSSTGAPGSNGECRLIHMVSEAPWQCAYGEQRLGAALLTPSIIFHNRHHSLSCCFGTDSTWRHHCRRQE